jgi:hypothetical protein
LTDSSSIADHKASSLYLDCARSARPLNTPPGSRSQPTGHVAHPIRSIETRSLPALTRSYPRHFTFYVAHPIRSIPVIPINPTPPSLNNPLEKLQQPILKLVRCPRSLAPALVTLPSMSLIPFAPFGRCNGKRTNIRDSSRRKARQFPGEYIESLEERPVFHRENGRIYGMSNGITWRPCLRYRVK